MARDKEKKRLYNKRYYATHRQELLDKRRMKKASLEESPEDDMELCIDDDIMETRREAREKLRDMALLRRLMRSIKTKWASLCSELQREWNIIKQVIK